eukprot:scaffold12565_cov121-Isochrysis_galbana.AAC.2
MVAATTSSNNPHRNTQVRGKCPPRGRSTGGAMSSHTCQVGGAAGVRDARLEAAAGLGQRHSAQERRLPERVGQPMVLGRLPTPRPLFPVWSEVGWLVSEVGGAVDMWIYYVVFIHSLHTPETGRGAREEAKFCEGRAGGRLDLAEGRRSEPLTAVSRPLSRSPSSPVLMCHVSCALSVSVGECLVGRHASGVAVEMCVGLGVRHVGSVGLPVFRRHRPGGRSSFT